MATAGATYNFNIISSEADVPLQPVVHVAHFVALDEEGSVEMLDVIQVSCPISEHICDGIITVLSVLTLWLIGGAISRRIIGLIHSFEVGSPLAVC